MTTPVGIDRDAPVIAHHEIDINLWGGANRGITGTHEWVYTQTPTGTHVATHESWSGQPVQADATAMQSALDKSLTDWLGHLKATAESTS